MSFDLLQEFDVDFTCSARDLYNLLNTVASVLSSKAIKSGFDSVLFAISESKMLIAASDIASCVIVSTDDVDTYSSGKFSVKLLDIQRVAIVADFGARISIKVLGDTIFINTSEISWEINTCSSSKVDKISFSVEHSFPVQSSSFLRAIDAVSFAVSKDYSRPNLSCIHFDNGVFTACDGVRMQRHTSDISIPEEFTIPVERLKPIVKRLRNLKDTNTFNLGISGKYLAFSIESDIFYIPKGPDTYPNLDRVFLKPVLENEYMFEVKAEDLEKAVIRASAVFSDKTEAVVALDLYAGSSIVSSSSGKRSASSSVKCSWDGPNMVLSLQASYLLDLLKTQPSGLIAIRVGKDSKIRRSPILVKSDSVVSVLQQRGA